MMDTGIEHRRRGYRHGGLLVLGGLCVLSSLEACRDIIQLDDSTLAPGTGGTGAQGGGGTGAQGGGGTGAQGGGGEGGAAPVCGNGVKEPGEACDDGFTDACGSCNADCSGPGTGATCGDGSLCPELEVCDDGMANECGSCNGTCTAIGTGLSCELAHIWSKGFAHATGAAVATDRDANVFVGGQYDASTSFGGQALSYTGSGPNLFLAKFDPAGTHLWSKGFGGDPEDYVAGVATDSAGNVIVTGSFAGTLDFGCTPLTSAGAEINVFIAKLDPTGTCLFAAGYGDGAYPQRTHAVATDSADNIVVVGAFGGTIDFGGTPIVGANAGDTFNIFVAKLDPAGGHMWAKSFGDGQAQSGFALAIDASDNIWLTGDFYGTITFGGPAVVSTAGLDVFLAKLGPAGNHLYSQAFCSDFHQTGTAVAVDSAGSVRLAGKYVNDINFGGQTLPLDASNYNVFLAKFNGSLVHQWSSGWGESGVDQIPSSVAVDSAGNTFLVGAFAGTINFGGSLFAAHGTKDAFLASFDSSGVHRASAQYGDTSLDVEATAVAVDPAGNPVVTGTMTGDTVDFGGGQRPGTMFLAKFGP